MDGTVWLFLTVIGDRRDWYFVDDEEFKKLLEIWLDDRAERALFECGEAKVGELLEWRINEMAFDGTLIGAVKMASVAYGVR